MITTTLWFILAGPLALAAIGLVPVSTAATLRLARGAALATLATALAMPLVILWNGPLHTGNGVPGFGLWFDVLTAVMFLLVAFVGTIVVIYSRNYMDGDPGHARFTRLLCVTLAAVLILILSGNLIQFALAWVATSLGLNRLLLFYPNRPAAILAARKKFLASRLGDLCLLAAILLIYNSFHSFDYAAIFAAAKAATSTPALAAAGVLTALAALLKSAQVPLHGWLTEVMETPTPVSALLHAGIINAGGFLLLRFADILLLSPPALYLLAIIGGFTALFASVVMLTQTSIKLSLAWSTIAQMGFMLLQCGLGAWSAALLHILAHSLYKAHAFLSSGSVIDIARASWSPSPGGQPHPARMGIAVGLVLAITLLVSTLFGVTPFEQPGVFALGTIMLLGLTHLIAQSIDERPNTVVIIRTLALAALVATGWFALQAGIARVMATTLPATAPPSGPLILVIALLVVLGFAAVTILQSTFARANTTPRVRALYVHVSNGFYVNTIANRLVLRLWPTRTPIR